MDTRFVLKQKPPYGSSTSSISRMASSNVRQVQNALNTYLSKEEKNKVIDALTEYHSNRNVVQFAKHLKVSLTSRAKTYVIPSLKTVIPKSDLETFEFHMGRCRKHESKSSLRSFASEESLAKLSTFPRYSHVTNLLPKSDSTSRLNVRNYLDDGRRSKQPNHIYRIFLGEPSCDSDGQRYGFTIKNDYDCGFGVYINDVERDGLAEKNGIRPGDILLEVNNISFRSIKRNEAIKIISAARCLELIVCRPGQISDLYSLHNTYVWLDCDGRTVSPPPSDIYDVTDDLNIGYDQQSPELQSMQRKVHVVVTEGSSLGLMIRGGNDFGLGIYVTGVDKFSKSDEAGLKVGDQILDVNSRSFLDISHSQAVKILRTSKRMIMLVRDVGKIPYAKSAIERIGWMDIHQHVPTTFTRHGPAPPVQSSDAEYESVFSRGAGSQLMFNSLKTNKTCELLERRATHLLNTTEQEHLRYHLREYLHSRLSLDDFISALSSLLNTQAKWSLVENLRSMLLPKHIHQFNAAVLEQGKPKAIRPTSAPHSAHATGHPTAPTIDLHTSEVEPNITGNHISESGMEGNSETLPVNYSHKKFARKPQYKIQCTYDLQTQSQYSNEKTNIKNNIFSMSELQHSNSQNNLTQLDYNQFEQSPVTTGSSDELNFNQFEATLNRPNVQQHPDFSRLHCVPQRSRRRNKKILSPNSKPDIPYSSFASVSGFDKLNVDNNQFESGLDRLDGSMKDSYESFSDSTASYDKYSHTVTSMNPTHNITSMSVGDHTTIGEAHGSMSETPSTESSCQMNSECQIKTDELQCLGQITHMKGSVSQNTEDLNENIGESNRDKNDEELEIALNNFDAIVNNHDSYPPWISDGSDVEKHNGDCQLQVSAEVHDSIQIAQERMHNHKDSGVFVPSSLSDSSNAATSPNNATSDHKSLTSDDSGITNNTLTNVRVAPIRMGVAALQADEKGEPDLGKYREKYGGIPLERIFVYKTKPTLGVAIEGGANTRQPLPRVISVQPGGSAHESSNLKVGHVLLEVNSRSLNGVAHKEAARIVAEAFRDKSCDSMELLVSMTPH